MRLKRKMMDYLRKWKANHGAECLMVNGARQVGKSYIIEEFGRSEYQSLVTLDFVKHPEYIQIFEGSLDAADIYSRITLLVPGAQLLLGETLIFLDEVQECPQARSALKYLAIDGSFDVIASGSLLSIRFRELAGAPSLPVGYERPVTMRPLDFEEFLWACGYDDTAMEALKGCLERMEPVPAAVNEKFMDLLREYLAVGGMPATVAVFAEKRDFAAAHESQLALHALYLEDIARYAPPETRLKARECYLSLPRQLAKENTRFQYSVVESRGSARKFGGAVGWLVGSEMVNVSRSVSRVEFPLAAYEANPFRLYANDTGMLMAMYGFEMKAAVVTNKLKGPMKGGLYENLVATMLSAQNVALRYWISTSTKHEIEFLMDGSDATVVPIEVKAGRSSTVSLNEMLTREDVTLGYKLIDGNLGRSGKKVTLPLYMAAFLSWLRNM